MKLVLNLTLIITLCVLVGCESSDKKSNSHHEWDYSGESGPQHWAELENGSDCGGQHQSPINIIDNQTTAGNIIMNTYCQTVILD